MKKLFKTFALLIVTAAACAMIFAFAGCKTYNGTYEGEYHYANPWSAEAPHYGIKVKVTVKKNVIKSVEVVDSDYVSASETPKWDKSKWDKELDGLLKSYVGKTVSSVKEIKVATDDKGAPEDGQELGGYLITNATLGSGRLLLAIQDALK